MELQVIWLILIKKTVILSEFCVFLLPQLSSNGALMNKARYLMLQARNSSESKVILTWSKVSCFIQITLLQKESLKKTNVST